MGRARFHRSSDGPRVEQDGPIDPAQLRLAERRLLEAMRRFHRREPLRDDLRVDRLIAELRATEGSGTPGHRGSRRLSLSDGELRSVVDQLVATGALSRSGHRVRSAEGRPALEPVMRARVDGLLRTLGASATPSPAEQVATRLGIPAALLDQLRASGELVAVAPGIDYPRRSWAEISERLDRIAKDGDLSVRRIRDELRSTRRHAEAILRRHREDRAGAGR